MARHIKALFDLTGRGALITGGSRGLGFQIAQSLGEAGARVIIAARKADELQEATATLRGAGIDADWIAADCAREDDINRLAAETLQRTGGKLDILVNNAGATWGAPAEDYPTEAWDKVMNLNVRGYFLLARAIGRDAMIPQKSGAIINVASVAALAGNPMYMKTIAYNASKAAALNFTRALASEWGPYNIRVNALCPGFFPSKMTHGLIAATGEERMTENVPLGRLGDDEDLKGAALLFACDAGKHITGQWIAVDGGASAVIAG